MPRPSFLENLRRRSFRRSPPQSRGSSSPQAVNGSLNGTSTPSINGIMNASGNGVNGTNGNTTRASSQAFENNSSTTIDTPESNSASPSEVSSSEMNGQTSNGTPRLASSRPLVNGNRSSMYYHVSDQCVDEDCSEHPIVDQYHRAGQSLRSPEPHHWRHEFTTLVLDPADRYAEFTIQWNIETYAVQVFQQAILLTGRVGDDNNNTRSGTLVVYHTPDFLPPLSSRVVESQFKQMIRLRPGANYIRLVYYPDARSSTGSASSSAHSTRIIITCIPTSAPPLELAILVGRDSTETYDAVPGRVQLEGNNLAMAVRKYKMAAYMWQAFTAETMRRNNFGFRTFRLDEEWQQTTLTYNAAYADRLAYEAKVHIIRLPQTIEEIRKMDYAQQNKDAQQKGKLYDIAMDACRQYFKPHGDQTRYVAAMFLDTHWDPATKVIRGHAALGGGDGKIQLAIFGSHCLQSYPASLEQIYDAFTDATRTDLNYVGNDCGNCGSSWEAANVGIAAHLHEVGHLFGCPHQENGLMGGDYFGFNRSFSMVEAFATRTGQRGHNLTDLRQESLWHRLDCLRFRFHPCFVRPDLRPDGQEFDPILPEDTVQVWAIDKSLIVTSSIGLAWIEVFGDGEDICKHHVEYYKPDRDIGPKQLKLDLDRIRDDLLLPPKLRSSKRLRLEIYSMGRNGHATIDDVYTFITSSKIRIGGSSIGNRLQSQFQGTQYAYRGKKLGFSSLAGSQHEEVLFLSLGDLTKVMTAITVYHGDMVDGLEFFYADGETQLFGKRGGKPGGTQFVLDTRLGEQLFGFYVRAGQWIDGLQIWTTQNRKSEMFGNPTGGSG